MTGFEWRDAKGRPCRLVVEVYNGESAGHVATESDLLAALGQLSPGSDGPPTMEDIQSAYDAAYLAAELAGERYPHDDAKRSLYNAGRAEGLALGEQKLAHEKQCRADEELSRKGAVLRAERLESELAATKAKLSEARAAQLAIAEAFGLAHHQSMGPAYPAPWSELLPVALAAAKAQAKLAEVERERDAMRRVVEAAKVFVTVSPLDETGSTAPFVRAEMELVKAVQALASATSSQPEEPAALKRGDGVKCHRCGHYEASAARAEQLAHCPSCGRHTRWIQGAADQNEWRVVDSVLGHWCAIGPWRNSEEEAHRDAEHGSMRGALPEPAATVPLADVEALEQVVSRLNAEPAAPDDPTLDATDGASPAWWRGHDSCAHEMSARLADALGVPPASWQELIARVKPEPAARSEVEALLRRIIKYAREDRARTPGVTRLARALAEAEALLAKESR